jgi:excisionase family DNA binding protein
MTSIPKGYDMTTAEVAAELGVHHYTVTRWCRAGIVDAIRVGHNYRVKRSSLKRAIGAVAEAKKYPQNTETLSLRLGDGERALLDAAAAKETDERGNPLKTSTWARRVLLAAARGGR